MTAYNHLQMVVCGRMVLDVAEIAKGNDVRLDARNLRGLAHPVRVRMLGLLRAGGPATATTLAKRLGLNTGATSYHLRQLAEHGFIVEADQGTRRERWWKAAHRNTSFPDGVLTGEEAELGDAFWRSVVQVQADGMLRAVDARSTLPERWREAQDFSDYLLRLTPDEARELATAVHKVVQQRRSGPMEDVQEPTAGTARVTFQFQMFPHPDDLSSDSPVNDGISDSGRRDQPRSLGTS